MTSRWLAIVPARAGSKGIPGKNLALVGGRPLIAFTLDALADAQSGLPNLSAFVSTDDLRVREVAEAAGFPVPVLRPRPLAGDRSPSIEFVRHALAVLGRSGETFDFVMVLQPTSPLRPAAAIVEAVRRLEAEPGADSLISGYRDPGLGADILYRAEENGRACPLTAGHAAGGRRQDAEPLLIRNGAIYAARARFVERTGRLFDDRPLWLEMPKALSLNVDRPEDLEELRARVAA